MIKNVIFDFGNVMARFIPEYMTGKYVKDKEDIRLLSGVIFDRLYWDKLDAGTIEDFEVVEACKERVPERLHGAVEEIYYSWIHNLPPIEGMSELVHRLKEEFGVRVFLLSNISHYFAKNDGEIPYLKEFDGRVYSAEVGFVKPERGIYEFICKEYSINPSEAIFIDDSEKNINGALDFGIAGYLFDGNAEKLRSYLFERLNSQAE